MKILITGSHGFVGGSVGRFAAAAGHDVLGLARTSRPEPDWPGQYAQADLLHTPLASLIAGFAPDMVLHGAGTASVAGSLAAPQDDMRTAVLTWAHTLEAIRVSGVRPLIVYPSSAAVYGNPVSLPISEDAALSPVSPYGFHKAACELIAREYAECFGLDILICRLFSVFGPRQRRLLVWDLFEQVAGHDPTVCLQGTGQESRDYLSMDDLADAILALAVMPASARSAPMPSGGRLRVVNLASGHETRVLDLAHQVCHLSGAQKTVVCHGIDRPGNPARWAADIGRLRTWLPEWRPRSLACGLAECLDTWNTDTGAVSHPLLSAARRARQVQPRKVAAAASRLRIGLSIEPAQQTKLGSEDQKRNGYVTAGL